MARHVRRRDPRGHWGLISLALISLTALLLLQGYATGSPGRGEALERPEQAAGNSPVAGSGPVLALGDREGAPTRSVRMPAKTIALTFDDGPDPTWTPKILDLLRQHDAKATFFVVGSQVARHPELTRRILAEGHELGSHTYTHVDVGAVPSWLVDLELGLTQQALAGATGHHTRLLRPPYSSGPDALAGQTYAATQDAARQGYAIVLADRDTKDWSGVGSERIVAAATPDAHDGAIVLMHDSGGDRRATVAAVGRLLTTLRADGYEFTTVTGGLGMPRSQVPVGGATEFFGTVLIFAQQASEAVSSWLLAALAVAGALTLLRFVLLLLYARAHVKRSRRLQEQLRAYPPFTPPISVVVPAYNEAAGIEATLRSLVSTYYQGPVDVVVIDDGSTDETARVASDLRLPNVRVFTQPNAGKAAALDAGIALARNEIIVMVDGDTVFEPTTLQQLVAPLADQRVGAVSGNTKVGNARGILGRWQHLEYVIGFNLDRRMFDVLQCMPTVPGAIGAFRRAALTSVGGVSTDTLAEDTDLTMALCRTGWRVVYADQARAWTEAPSSLGQLWRQRYRWCYGTLQAMWKHKRALVSRGQAGRFGRRCLTYLSVFQVALPLLAPAVDIFALYEAFAGSFTHALGVWAVFVALQAGAGAYALRLDRESLGVLWVLPLQQFVYRQLMYLVTIQSVVTALVGAPLRWHIMRREGTFARNTRNSATAMPTR